MIYQEFGWESPSKVKIYAQSWMPDPKKFKAPKAIILVIHGLGEHSGRYEHLAEYFCAKGIGVLANDRSGHGKSGGKKGHIAKYEQTLDDIVKLHSEASRRFPNVPVFLYGHSMGGGIVLNYILRKKKTGLKGCIATGPALKLAFEPSKFMVGLGKFMRGIWPSFSQNNELDVNQVSRDATVVKAYVDDPLVHSKITSETGIGLLEFGKYALDNVGKLNLPVLVMHGSKDGLTSPEGTTQFAEKAEGDITLKIWDGLYHEIHNEPEQQEVFDYTYQWMQSKL